MANYVLLERIELNASAASVTFSNIPQTGYTDLKVVVSARTDKTGQVDDYVKIAFNGVSTNQTARILYGTGSAAGSTTDTAIYGPIDAAATASTFSNTEFYIPNYTSTTAAKSVSVDSVLENNATAATSYLTAGLWNPGTQASITTIALTPYYGPNFVQYSTFSLYGLAAVGTTPAIAPKASGGNRIDYDGTYWIHTFTSSGTFTPSTALTCDYLVVAGGGGGACSHAPGGGAGGVITGSINTLSGTNYSLTIGAGGSGTGDTASQGSDGNSTTAFSLTAGGGGGGGRGFSNVGVAAQGRNGLATNGSGGGAGSQGTGGTGNGTGKNGGNGNGTSPGAGGGGGGAGAAGSPGTGSGGGGAFGGAGGIGVISTITGASVYYAGGGGGAGWSTTGASGGLGGGGKAGNPGQVGTAGTANTGGGGGGGGDAGAAGASGGSGVVIIRYLA